MLWHKSRKAQISDASGVNAAKILFEFLKSTKKLFEQFFK